LLVVSAGNIVITYVTPVLIPQLIRGYTDAVVAIFTIFVVIIVSLRMRRVYRRLLIGVASRMGRQRGANERIERFLYIATLALVATTILLVSFPLIVRTFGGALGELGSGLAVLIVIVVFFLFAWRAALNATQRLEETFQIKN
jgi:hypothetical protein